MVIFGEWAPDQPKNPAVLNDALNVIPASNLYRSLPTVSTLTNAVGSTTTGSTVLGAFSTRLVSGNAQTYVGSASALYQRNGANWTNVSGATYTITTGRWEFTQFESDIYACSIDEDLQRQAAGSGNFTIVTGGPQAACIANVRDWVFVGDVIESAVSIPHKVRWCAIADPTDWVISEATQSGSQPLDAADGRVMAIRGGEFGIILQQHAVTRATYVGTPIVWQFDKIDNRNGCEASGSVVQVGRKVFYLSYDGFRVTDGSGESENISDGRIWKWFQSSLKIGTKSKIRGAYDPYYRCIFWSYPSSTGSGENDAMIIYHVEKNRWARADYGVQFLLEGSSSSVTLDGLDTYFSSIDSVSPALDDPFWVGGEASFFVITSNKLGTLTATPGTAVIETNEFQANPGAKTRIMAVEPVIDATSTVAIGYRNLPSDSVSYTPAAIVNTRTGQANFQHVSRWQRLKFSVSGWFYDAVGYNVNAKKAGIV